MGIPRDLSAEKRYLLQLLARREYSALELRQRLARRSCTTEDIAALLDWAKVGNFQSDHRFAEQYTLSRLRKGFGPRFIRRALRERGISDDLIAENLTAIAEYVPESLHTLWLKKFRAQCPGTGPERAKQLRFFQQRGFGMAAISGLWASTREGVYED